MSSGEKAKPPTTFEERNPFDISRNSGPEVASEIAKRMAAWKQARARTNPAPMTQPATNQSGTISTGDAKPPPIAAPVLPARMPKAARAPQPPQATASAGSAAPRVPYFAVSATRRAMPPAPSPKEGSARPPALESDGRAVPAEDSTIMPPAPVRERASQDQDERPPQPADVASTPELPAVEASTIVPAAIDETVEQPTPAQAEPSDTHPFESPLAAEASEPSSAEPDERERRRAEARAIKRRWIAARDLDALLESPAASGAGVAQAVDAAEARSRDAGTLSARDAGPAKDASPLVGQPQGAEADLVRWSPEEPPRDVGSGPDSASEAAAQVDGPATPTVPMAEPNLEPPESQTIPIAAPDEAVGRSEPTFNASDSVVSQTAPVANRAAERETQALDIAALDEMAGRKEPTFDAPVARTVPETLVAKSGPSGPAPDEIVAPLRVDSGAGEALGLTTASRGAADEQRVLSIAALDAVAGRKEPTFDPPLQPAASDRTSEAQDEAIRAPIARATAEAVMPAHVEAARELPVRSAHALDETAGRKEPTFDEPARPAMVAPAPAPAQKAPPVKLRPIETRIEARRVDMLRADPQMSARRPILPPIEPAELHVPPTFAARANRERRGTGWAIGLGSLLLIAGITAPAAIWQQGRQAEDQAALVTPAPATQQSAATPSSSTSGAATSGAPTSGAATAQAPAQATLPAAPSEAPPSEAAPSEATPPEAPAATAQQSSAPEPVEPKPEAEETNAPPATTLSAIGNSDDVNEAPIVAPPPPMVNLASKAGPAGTGSPMVARPFVPEQGDGPFLRPPTTGSASVPVGTPQPGAKPVETGVKPNLIGLLKPKAAAVASKSKPVSSKPRTVQRQPKPFFQQSPDQMFETLIETLSEGRPVNPNTKPASPSNRR